jgi:imidazolonepropionase-like amidohydrolase
MSETEAIVAATVNSAEAMGWSNQVGTLEPGKYADLIAVQSSPLQDIAQLLQVVCVVKGGVVYECPVADSPPSAARSGSK